MGGIFGVAAKENCTFDLFFGVDYHSHLGTRYGGMAVYDMRTGFEKTIHNIENSPFRTKFERDVHTFNGQFGIGCIADSEPQPLLVNAHFGTYALTTVGRINNVDEIIKKLFQSKVHFTAMSHGEMNQTELVAALINQEDTILEGIQAAQQAIEGSMTLLALTKEGIYAARDLMGRTPLSIGQKDGAHCVSFEDFAYHNLGYRPAFDLGPGEIALITPDSAVTLVEPRDEMKICTFLWVYYGYPTATYEGVNVEQMRNISGAKLAERDDEVYDLVAGIPDSGTAHAIGYANRSSTPFARPFIKYTPTWPRSFMPVLQTNRNLIARMKMLPVDSLIKDKRLLLVEDSIVRGTQMRETTEFLYSSGAKEVHVRTACPPILYGCKYINFSRSTSDMDLIARRIIARREGEKHLDRIDDYTNELGEKYEAMIEAMRVELNFQSLKSQLLTDMISSCGIEPCKACTYCWNGKS